MVVYNGVEFLKPWLCFPGPVQLMHTLQVRVGLMSAHTQNQGILFSSTLLSESPPSLSKVSFSCSSGRKDRFPSDFSLLFYHAQLQLPLGTKQQKKRERDKILGFFHTLWTKVAPFPSGQRESSFGVLGDQIPHHKSNGNP